MLRNVRHLQSRSLAQWSSGHVIQSLFDLGGPLIRSDDHRRLHLAAEPPLHNRLPKQTLQSTRQLSQMRSRGNQRKGMPAEPQILTNERLVATIMEQLRASNAEDVDVRMVVDPTSTEKSSTTEVVSLAAAIRKSIDLDRDLIEVSVEQKPPVIRVTNLQSMIYKQNKKPAKTQKLVDKEIRFSAGIGQSDMERKLAMLTGYVEKGHSCVVQVQSKWADRKRDPNAVRNTISKIVELVEDIAEPSGQPKMNAHNSRGHIRLQPMTKKMKKKDEA